MWLFALFVAIPIIEIALFIQIGGLIGLWPTLLVVLVTAVLGTVLVRNQGALALNQLRGSFERLDNPAEPLANGAMILIAGVLLLTPGFFTDAVGFALLMPPVRSAAFRAAKNRINVSTFQMGPDGMHNAGRPPSSASSDIIEGDFSEISPSKKPTHGPSGWTKH